MDCLRQCSAKTILVWLPNHKNQHRRRFMQRRLCFKSGGISKAFFTQDVYCSQLKKLHQNIQQKKPEIASRKGVPSRQRETSLEHIFAKHYIIRPTFSSLQNLLNAKLFCDLGAIIKYLDYFFPSKPTQFHADGRLTDSIPEFHHALVTCFFFQNCLSS